MQNNKKKLSSFEKSLRKFCIKLVQILNVIFQNFESWTFSVEILAIFCENLLKFWMIFSFWERQILAK